MSDSLQPYGPYVAYQAPLSLGKNTGVDCHALLQRIFPTQELNNWVLQPCPRTTLRGHTVLLLPISKLRIIFLKAQNTPPCSLLLTDAEHTSGLQAHQLLGCLSPQTFISFCSWPHEPARPAGSRVQLSVGPEQPLPRCLLCVIITQYSQRVFPQ